MKRASEIPELKSWPNPPLLHVSCVKKALRSAWRRHFGEICQSCERPMHFEIKFRKNKHFATIDHIIARSINGSNGLDNIQVICLGCNGKKSVDEFHQSNALG